MSQVSNFVDVNYRRGWTLCLQEIVSSLMLEAQSTTKDYIRAEGDFQKEIYS